MSELRKDHIARASAGALPLGHCSRAGLHSIGGLLLGFFDLDGRREPIDDARSLSDGHDRGRSSRPTRTEQPYSMLPPGCITLSMRVLAGSTPWTFHGHVIIGIRASIDLIRHAFRLPPLMRNGAPDVELAEMAVFSQGVSQELVEHFERRVWMTHSMHVELLTQRIFARRGLPEPVAVGGNPVGLRSPCVGVLAGRTRPD